MTLAETLPTPHLHKLTAAPRTMAPALLLLPAPQQGRCNGSWEWAVMGSTPASTLLAQVRAYGFGRVTTAVRFIVASVTAQTRMHHGVAGYQAAGVATRNHSFCHTIFSMVGSPEAMTVRQLESPAAAVISLPAAPAYGRQFMGATPLSIQRTGMSRTIQPPRT